MKIEDVSDINPKLRHYINNVLFMNKVKETEQYFDEFYKDGMGLEGEVGFDLFDQSAMRKG